MSLWTRRETHADRDNRGRLAARVAARGEKTHAMIYTFESLAAAFAARGMDKKTADRHALYGTFRAEGMSTTEAHQMVDRLMPGGNDVSMES